VSTSKKNGVVARSAERAVGERSAARHDPPTEPAGVPDPEFVAVPTAKRRSFTAKFKLQILQEADRATETGQIAAMLRREGLYSSHLVEWRKARDNGALQALQKPRGRPKADPRDAEIAKLQRRLERAEQDLEKARKVIEVQGNVSALLGELLEPRSATDKPSKPVTGR
jgi:transposase-like protein